MKRKYQRIGISVLLASSLLLTACQGQGETKEKTDGDGKEKQASMETAKLADSIRQKYEENYVYAEPIKDVARDEHLKLQMGFDIMNSEFTEYTQIVNVFKDAELTQPIGSHFEWDEETKELEVTPPRWSVGGIMSEGLSEEDPGYQPADTSLLKNELLIFITCLVKHLGSNALACMPLPAGLFRAPVPEPCGRCFHPQW